MVTQLSQNPADIVNLVRDVFGLNASDAAQVFGVNLSTIYLWLYHKEFDSIAPDAQKRMRELELLAIECKNLEPLSAGALRATLPDSILTLLTLLSDKHIDHDKIVHAYQYLKSMTPIFRQREYEKTVKVVTGLKHVFSSMGKLQAARKKI